MATVAEPATPFRARVDLRPSPYDRFLAFASGALLVAVSVALIRGRAELAGLPLFLKGHIATIYVALALTPLMMLRRRGDRLHRRLGWVWVSAIMLTAALSFGVRGINSGGLSFIHILSAWTLLTVPFLVLAARRHDPAAHRGHVRGIVTGALLVAGLLTFPGGRLMGDWLLG